MAERALNIKNKRKEEDRQGRERKTVEEGRNDCEEVL